MDSSASPVQPLPHDHRESQIQVTNIVFIVLATISISLRLHCRVFVIKNFGWDDIFAVVAWVLFVSYSIFSLMSIAYGSGRHIWDITPEDLPVGLKYWWLCESLYVLSNMFLKLSISVFLLRLSSVPLHRYIILATLAVSEVGGTFYFLVFIFQCQPSRYFWTKFTGESGTCVDANFTVVAGYAYSAISCATDWILSLIPIWVICTLQMTPRDKISVAIILSMGAIASTATIIRMPYLRDLSNVDDFLFATVDVAIWSTTETCIGIIASSAATLRPLFRNFFTRTKLFGNSTTGQSRLSTNWSRHPDSEGGGYIRQNNLNSDVGALSSARSGEDSDDCKLRDDIPLHSGVITTIATGKKKAREHYDDVSNEPLPHATDGGGQGIELESAPLQDPRPAALKGKPLGKRISRHGGKWGGVRGKSRDWSDSRSLSIEDSILGMGITKTTNTEIRSVRMSRVGGGQKSRE